MPQYTNPGSAFVTHIDAYLAKREAKRIQDMLEDRQEQRDALEAHREERIAAGEIDDREERKKDIQRAEEEKRYRRGLEKARSFVKGDIPGSDDVKELKELGLFDAFFNQGTPGGAMSEEQGQGPVQELPPIAKGSREEREKANALSQTEAKATEIAEAIYNAKTPQEAMDIGLRAGMSPAESQKLVEMYLPKTVMNVDSRSNTVRSIGELPPNSVVAQESYPAASSSGSGSEGLTLSPRGLDMAARTYAKTGQLPAGSGTAFADLKSQIIDRASYYDTATDSFANAGTTGPSPDIAGNTAGYKADAGALAQVQRTYDAASAFSKTADKNAEMLTKVLDKIPDTGNALVNMLARPAAKAFGSEDMAVFNAIRQSVQSEYARLINNPNLTGVLSDSARKEIETVLSPSATVGQLKAALDTLKQEGHNRTTAYEEQINEIKSRIGGRRKTDTPQEKPTTGMTPKQKLEYYRQKKADK